MWNCVHHIYMEFVMVVAHLYISVNLSYSQESFVINHVKMDSLMISEIGTIKLIR